MDGLIMDYQLNVAALLRRGEQLFGDREIVTRLPDRSWHRYTYADFAPRARRLAAALRNELGLKDGDRVGTFAWNHYQHLETYIGVPVGGMVTHTLNLRLHPDDITYIATHAGDRVLIADKVLWPLVENFRERAGFEHVVAIGDGPTPDGAIEYEDLLASRRAGRPPRPRDRRANGRGHVLHERHHRSAERRGLFAPCDRGPHDGERDRRRPLGDGEGLGPPRRADVPRERVGLPVHVHVRRREAGLPRPASSTGRACSRRSRRRR